MVGDLTFSKKNGTAVTTGNVITVNVATGTGFDVDGNGTIEGTEKNTVKVSIDLDSNSTYDFALAKGAVTDLDGNVNAKAIKFNVTSGTFQPATGTTPVTDTTPAKSNPKVTGTFRIVDKLWINAL